MDTTGKIYIGIGIVVLIGMIVLFWFISKRCAQGRAPRNRNRSLVSWTRDLKSAD